MSSPLGSRDEGQQSYYNLEGGRAGKSCFLEQTLFSALGAATHRRGSWEQRLHLHAFLVFPVLPCMPTAVSMWVALLAENEEDWLRALQRWRTCFPVFWQCVQAFTFYRLKLRSLNVDLDACMVCSSVSSSLFSMMVIFLPCVVCMESTVTDWVIYVHTYTGM